MVGGYKEYDQSGCYSIGDRWFILYHCHIASSVLFVITLVVSESENRTETLSPTLTGNVILLFPPSAAKTNNGTSRKSF